MGRPLTSGEIALAQSIYGNLIDYNEVEIEEMTGVASAAAEKLGTPRMAVTPYGTPSFSDQAHRTDFSSGSVDTGLKALFIHELGHVLQHQSGMKVPNQIAATGDSYNYDAIFHGKAFHELPPEAQAEFLEDVYRLQNSIPLDPDKKGGDLEDPNRPLSEYLERLPDYLPNGEATDSVPSDLAIPHPNQGPVRPDYPEDVAPVTELPGQTPGGGGAGGGGLEPLVFDLDASGTIDLVSLANGVHFDFWGDGYAEKVGWAAPTDGMLAIDLDESGTINNGAELFGSQFPLTYLVSDNWDAFINEENGFAKLAKYDLVANGGNNDGAITSADSVWSDLVMWQDANSDGVSQSGEMLTLGSFGITSIDVSAYELENFNGLSSGTPFSRIIQGNTVTHTGTFTMNSVEREVVDVWFSSDLSNTIYVGDYTVDPITWVLPNVRGYGMVANLDIAMNLNEDLLDDVTDFVMNHDFEDLFDDASADIENIMLNWAGLDANTLPEFDYSKHGVFEELKEYWFLRKFMGQDNDGLGTWFDMSAFMPRVNEAMPAMREAYSNLLNAFSARLIFQSGGAELFEDGVSYNSYTDEFEGTFALSHDAVDDLETAAGTSGDVEAYWRDVAKFIDNTMGLGELSGTELGWLDDAVDDSSSGALEWADIIATLSAQSIYGTNGADTINGTDYDDNIYSHALPNEYSDTGNDILNGGAGNDYLFAGGNYATTDTLNGGLGDDILEGGAGNDTYIYDYGHDVIIEYSPASYTDVIQLASGITTSDVSIHFARMDFNSTQPHLFLEIEGRGTITIKGISGTAWTTLIDQIQFNGGPTWTLSSTPVHFHGANGDDVVYANGFTANNFVFGYDGDDILNGNTGADTFYGGDGNDDLRGDSGNDLYMVSAGNDVIRETGGTEKILTPDGYTIDDISFLRVELGGTYGSYDEMKIVVDGLGSLSVLETLTNSSSSKNVETLELFGGTQINLKTTVFTTVGTTGNDAMYGTPTAWGQLNDIYLFSGGTDTVNESYGGSDILQFGEGVLPGDITLSRVAGNSFKDLKISDNSGNSIKFINHFTDTSSMLSSLEQIKFANGTTWNLSSLEIEAVGTSSADTINGYDYGDASTRDVIFADAGNDQVYGNAGDDEIHGGDGTDNLNGGEGSDVIYGDDGDDTVVGGNGYDTLLGGAGNDWLQGQNDNDILEGGDGDDLLYGGGGDDTVSYAGATSAVTVSLATGTAQNTVGAGSDTISQTENLTGSGYNDTLTGSTAANTIRGGAGNDTISSGNGNDILYGDAGTDTLTGGANADTFIFEALTALSASDTITDFSTAQVDKLNVSDILDLYNPLTDLISDFVRITDNGTHSFLSVDADGGANSFTQIAQLSSVTNIATGATATEGELQTLIANGMLIAA